ncbi:hypothetical protein [Clostridium niameyense]|uniref:hypothetical protein n=1 Tax=Clostridium niameyense TaxID=1622073 RepID=UPI00067E9EF6|nr:hypothetical protein [Clostridium niameyense]
MNRHCNKIPNHVLSTVNSLIKDCGMSKEEFIKNLANAYDINSGVDNYYDLLKDYDTYCDSFVS